MNRTTSSLKAYRETSFRFLKKLLVLVLGLAAFFGLQGLENLKTNYDKEKAAPIVIVENATQNQSREYVIKLDRNRLDEELKQVIHPSDKELQDLEKRGDAVQHALVVSLKKFADSVKAAIPAARRIPFESEGKFVNYLSESINKAKTDAEEKLASARKKRTAQIAELRARFLTEQDNFLTELKKKPESDTDFIEKLEKRIGEQKSKAVNATAQPGAPQPSNTITTDGLASIANGIEDQRESENLAQISQKAYDTLDGLHRTFVATFLTQYIKDQKKNSPHPSTFSEMVLDEHRGGHVIYQVFYLAFIAVLVFGVLFPIYLLLGAIPPFAGTVDPLTERAKDLLSRRGIAAMAAPGIAKTVALSAAAIGIGAAVVIANNPVTAPKNQGDEIAAAPSPDIPNTWPPGPGPRPSPAFTPIPGVTPGPSPEPSPAPSINFYPTFSPTFTMDNGRLAQLERDYGAARTRLNAIEDEKLPAKLEPSDLMGLVTNAEFAPISREVSTLPAIRDNVGILSDQVQTLSKTTIPYLTRELSTKTSDLSDRLNATNTAITGFREGTQGPSILKRARELLGRERYQATRASHEVLKSLMCRKTDCPSGTTPTQDCCIAGPSQRILDNLERLIGEAPMRKNTFLERLGVRPGGVTPSGWEAVILRYNRAPF